MRDQTTSSDMVFSENEMEYDTIEYSQPTEWDGISAQNVAENAPEKPRRSRTLLLLSWFLMLLCTGYAGCRYYVGDPVRLFAQTSVGQRCVAWKVAWSPFQKTDQKVEPSTILAYESEQNTPDPHSSESKTLAEISSRSISLNELSEGNLSTDQTAHDSDVASASAIIPAKVSQRVVASHIGNEIADGAVVSTSFQSTVFHTPDPNRANEPNDTDSNGAVDTLNEVHGVNGAKGENSLVGMPKRFPQSLTPNAEPCELENLDTDAVNSDASKQRENSNSTTNTDTENTQNTTESASTVQTSSDSVDSTEASKTATRPEENDPNIRIILMDHGRFFRGYVTEEATRYLVEELSGSEIVLPKERVLTICQTIQEAYEYQKSHEIPTADEILRLTGWCIQEKLWDEAEAELAIAEDVAAEHPQLPLVRQRLAVAKQMALSPPEALKSTVRAAASGPSAEILAKMMAAMPPESASIFVRDIQPMLLNTCTTSGCHLREEEGRFALSKPGAGMRPTQRQTERNLYAVLQWIDRDAPLESPLLTVAIRPHGTQRTAPFHNRPERSYWTLVAWSCMVCGMESPHSQESDGLDSLDTPQYASGVMPAGFTAAGDMLNANQGRAKPELRERPKLSPLGIVMPTAIDRRSATLVKDEALEQDAAELETLNASNPRLTPGESSDVWSSVAQASAAQNNGSERMETTHQATNAVAVTSENADSVQNVQWTTDGRSVTNANGNTAEPISNTQHTPNSRASHPAASNTSSKMLDPFDPAAFNAVNADAHAADASLVTPKNGTRTAAQLVPETVITSTGRLNADANADDAMGSMPFDAMDTWGNENEKITQEETPSKTSASQTSNLVTELANQPATMSPLALAAGQTSGTSSVGTQNAMGFNSTKTNTTAPQPKRRTLRPYREVMGDR